MNNDNTLLDVSGLEVSFLSRAGGIKAVDGISFSIKKGEIFALVGESGSGKSVTAMSIMGILPHSVSSIDKGNIRFSGRDLLSLNEKGMRRIRGSEISMIFQEPLTSLNPVIKCGDQITEAILLHKRVGVKEAEERAVDLLDKVGIPDPGARFSEYPHQLSGGMRQRVMIAMALSCSPKLLIADEPTTALDVTIQAQILNLLDRLRKENDMSILLITHDLSVVSENADRVSVMYTGKVSESASCSDLFYNPLHPYTKSLLRSIPTLETGESDLKPIPGSVPDPSSVPRGCSFHPRCYLTRNLASRYPEKACNTDSGEIFKECIESDPGTQEVAESHLVRCPYAERDKIDG